MYQLSALSNEDLLEAFAGLVAQDRRTPAALLAHIAEIDARHLYLRDGHESMRSYCLVRLGLSEDAAAKRIQVARLTRELPALFPAIADGRLSLFSVRLLAPRLTSANVDELIAEASGKSAAGIQEVLARRFPKAEALRLDDGITPQVAVPEADRHAVRHVDFAPAAIAPRVSTRIAPISPDRYTLQLTLPKETHDKLRRLQALLGHAVPDGDVVRILDRSFDALLDKVEKRKFGSPTAKAPRAGGTRRSIPAQIRRAVYERDGRGCVALLENGMRCGSQDKLE